MRLIIIIVIMMCTLTTHRLKIPNHLSAASDGCVESIGVCSRNPQNAFSSFMAQFLRSIKHGWLAEISLYDVFEY